MSYQQAVFVSKGIYHITNRGLEKGLTFVDEKDCQRFIETLEYYRSKNPPARFSFRNRPSSKKGKDETFLVEVIAFCLMPNRFRILIKQLMDGGATTFLSKVQNSYTKYFNGRHQRGGPIFRSGFKAVAVMGSEQLLQVCRYIHLNPLIDRVVRDLKRFPYSSYLEFLGEKEGFCHKEEVLSHFNSIQDYEKFVLDQEDYEKSIKTMARLLL